MENMRLKLIPETLSPIVYSIAFISFCTEMIVGSMYSITCADSWHLSHVQQVPSLILNQHTYITI